MKNQYFGDVHDYRKYGLLRALQPAVPGLVLVAWMLTPDDGSQDGNFRAYLQDPGRWRRYDPTLYDGLANLLRPAAQRAVSLIERSSLLPSASFHSALVPDGRTERAHWRQGLLDAARDADLVFLDPDNGLEVKSRPVGRKHSSKYVTWSELEDLWGANCSLLVYQHFRREKREPFARRMAAELRRRTGAPLVEAFRTSHVLFLLAAQERHAEHFVPHIKAIPGQWHDEIRPLGLSG